MAQYIEMPIMGLRHFCIRHPNPVEALTSIFPVPELSGPQTVPALNWDFLYGENSHHTAFILLTELNGWSYLIWNYEDFDPAIDLAQRLSAALQTTVNFYFMDSYVATSQWILAENGVVTRAHYESHGEKLVDIGFSAVEQEIRNTVEETFVEDVFWPLYERTCQWLEYVNMHKRKEIRCIYGSL